MECLFSRWRCALLVAAALFFVTFAGLHAAEPTADKGTDPATEPQKIMVKKTATPLAIDGVLDEPAWQQAAVTEVNYVWGKKGQKIDSPRLLVRTTWDDNYLYIGYEAFDENLLALGSGEQEGPAGNQREAVKIHDPEVKVDVVEFFIGMGVDDFFWELHHNAANQFSDIWCAVVDEKKSPLSQTAMARFGIHFGTREFLADDPDAGCTFAKAVKLKPKADGKPSTVNDPSDKDTGYVGELRLPWAGLGAYLKSESWIQLEPKTPNGPKPRKHGPWKMAGTEIKMFSVIQDGDAKEHYFHPSPHFPGGWFHRGTAHWLRYKFEE